MSNHDLDNPLDILLDAATEGTWKERIGSLLGLLLYGVFFLGVVVIPVAAFVYGIARFFAETL